MPNKENCKICGEELIGYKQFCGSCGSEVQSSEDIAEKPVQLEDVPDTPAKQTSGTSSVSEAKLKAPKESVEELMKVASKAMKNKDMDGSLSALGKVLEIDPRNAKAWNNKAVILAKKGMAEDAIDAFDKAIDLSPNVTKLWIAKGTVLLKSGNKELAKASFKKALEIDPENEMASEKLVKCQ